MRARILVFLVIVALLPVADVFSQYPSRGGYGDRGRGGPGGPGYGDRGRGGPGGPGGPGYGRPTPGMPPGGPRPGQPQPGQPQPGQPQPGGPRPGGPQPGGSAASAEAYAKERASRMEGYLRDFDKNGDGTIHPNEVTDERQKRMLGYIAQRYGFEAGKPIQLSKLRESMTNSTSSSSRTKPEEGKKPEAEDDQPPLVPGFGVSQEDAPAIPRFGQRVGRQVITSAPPAAAGAKPPAQPVKQPGTPVDEKEKVRNFANTVLRKHDINHNGRLDRNEWEGVKPDPQTADRDHNGVVTLDELTAALLDYSKGRAGDDDWAAFNPYRAMTPWERLPDELPDGDHFMELDANGDGQVAMAEFTTFWDEVQAAEFDFKDRNGDGMITPSEWIAADAVPEEERFASAAPVATPATSSALMRGGPPSANRFAPEPPSPVISPAAKPAAEAEGKTTSKQWWE